MEETFIEKYDIKIEYNFVQLISEYEEFKQVRELNGKIILVDISDSEENVDEIEIGEVEIHQYIVNNDLYQSSLYDSFHRTINTACIGLSLIDFETDYIKDEILDKVGYNNILNILVIQEIILKKPYRNKGIGFLILKNIEDFFSNQFGYTVLKSFPKQHDVSIKKTKKFSYYDLNSYNGNYTESQESLNLFYSRSGYLNIDKENNIFIKNLSK